MADKGTKRKPKAKREKASVLGNLPATRPQRLGRPRTDTPEVSEAPPPPAAPAKRELPRHKPPVGPARVQASAASSRGNGAAAKPARRAKAAANGGATRPAAAKAAAAQPPPAQPQPAPATPPAPLPA